MSKHAIVSIVGRVNVGKSTLFNRLTRTRSAIVENTPGVTRDRKEGLFRLREIDITLIDTGGIDSEIDTKPAREAQRQSRYAIEHSNLVVFLLDIRSGLLPGDEEIAEILRKSDVPVIPVANKVDHDDLKHELYQFARLGFGDIIPISAEHNLGTAKLLKEMYQALGGISTDAPEIDYPEIHETRVAIIGRPNVGKSSLVNALIGEERQIVTDVPGTTRDSIDTMVKVNDKLFRLIDTAGLRRLGKTRDKLDKISAIMTRKSIERCHVAILMVDATEGVTAQDARIANLVVEQGRGLIVAANKWDLTPRTTQAYKELMTGTVDRYPFLAWIPILTISALERKRIFKIFDTIDLVKTNLYRKVPTTRLNKLIHDAQDKHPAPRKSTNKHPIKFYYATQTGHLPPTFLIFTNTHETIHFSYERYLVNLLRDQFDFTGCTVKIVFRHKNKPER